MKKNVINCLVLVLTFGVCNVTRAACTNQASGTIFVNPSSCEKVNPKQIINSLPKDNTYYWLKGANTKIKRGIYKQYTGVLVKGTVVRSAAKQDITPIPGQALLNKDVSVFIPGSSFECTEGKYLGAKIKEICCTSTSDTPCLLKTPYLSTKSAWISKKKLNKGKSANSKEKSAEEEKAGDLFDEREFEAALKLYKPLYRNEQLTNDGLFKLGSTLRELEKCKLAVKPLKKLYNLYNSKKYSQSDLPTITKGIFLLSRCHAMNKEADFAVFYLQTFAQFPKKYKSELRASLRHPDFGYISSTKDYKEYKVQVMQLINR